ncbi:DNA repair protein RAD51 homolog 3 [Hyalella azteca]|uniref:DNA repair protein RAD51 homolog 3 n=1 Tax=Hyalella azteca TaxID=294128 RepID=A0A8B7NF43_HYAAZ|nr:DNA repair protein RAD51 homolog 3 [Hyalella azteca]
MKEKERTLISLGLPTSVTARLHMCNLIKVHDLLDFSPTHLSEVTGLNLMDCCEALRLCSSVSSENAGQTVLDMIEEGGSLSHIITLCPSLDEVLGGGVLLGALTEVVGTPGAGKTQLCLQLSVSVQLPKWCHGMEGEAVFIDAEGSFIASRLLEIADSAVSHCDQLRSSDAYQNQDKEENGSSFTSESILKNVHYFRCLSQLSVASCVKLLPEFISKHPRVRIVIIDSIAFHLRHDTHDNRIRTSQLCSITQDLIQLATNHRVAVVVTNQMTTRIAHIDSKLMKNSECLNDRVSDDEKRRRTATPHEEEMTEGRDLNSSPNKENLKRKLSGARSDTISVSESVTTRRETNATLTPALGESWGHCATIRLLLRWQHGRRNATLLKSPHKATASCSYAVTAAGIRGLLET